MQEQRPMRNRGWEERNTMGVTITAANPKYEFDMGYFGFFQLRKEIALALDEEFGRNYADLAHCCTQKEYAANDKAANRIIRKNHLDRDADVLNFLYMSDSEGEVGYKTCGNILRLIRNRKDVAGFRYGSMQHNDWEEFREFLQDCYSHRKKMRWH